MGRLIFKAHRLVYDSTLGLRVIKKKKVGRLTTASVTMAFFFLAIPAATCPNGHNGHNGYDGYNDYDGYDGYSLYTKVYSVIYDSVRCPLSIFCSRGTPPRGVKP